ncbi:MAG: hypothetical protein AAF394_01590 [Planctomycetota bacterium]
MIVTGKSIGSKRRLFEDWSIPMPPEAGDGDGGGMTLEKLIERIVREEVANFKKRQHDRQFLRALSAEEIAQGEEKGKIEMGGSEVGLQHVDVDESVAAALQAFEDGIYLVAIDDEQITRLEQQIYLQPDSRITFIRLTMLSGG